jgi:hypothetical protein
MAPRRCFAFPALFLSSFVEYLRFLYYSDKNPADAFQNIKKYESAGEEKYDLSSTQNMAWK